MSENKKCKIEIWPPLPTEETIKLIIKRFENISNSDIQAIMSMGDPVDYHSISSYPKKKAKKK